MCCFTATRRNKRGTSSRTMPRCKLICTLCCLVIDIQSTASFSGGGVGPAGFVVGNHGSFVGVQSTVGIGKMSIGTEGYNRNFSNKNGALGFFIGRKSRRLTSRAPLPALWFSPSPSSTSSSWSSSSSSTKPLFNSPLPTSSSHSTSSASSSSSSLSSPTAIAENEDSTSSSSIPFSPPSQPLSSLPTIDGEDSLIAAADWEYQESCYLTEFGVQVCEFDAFEESNWFDDTRNIDDTAISALYVKEQLQPNAIIMMSLCFLVAIICSLDRVAMSVAILPMSNEYGFSETTKGLISSCFSWGYMVAMIPAGILSTIFSPKTVMGYGVVLWSLAQIISPFAAATSLPALLCARFAMGMSEAVTLPTIQVIVREWSPQNQRSRWLSLIISGLQVGTVIAYLASPEVINVLGWQGLFILYGSLGLAWMMLWLPLAKDTAPSLFARKVELPPPLPAATAAGVVDGELANNVDDTGEEGGGEGEPAVGVERELAVAAAVEAEAQVEAAKSAAVLAAKAVKPDSNLPQGFGEVVSLLQGVPWEFFLRDKRIWSIAGAHMAHNWGLYVMLAWLPTFFSQQYGLSVAESSSSSVLPWVVGAVTGNMSGWMADGLVNKGVLSLTATRKLFQTLALLGPGASMLLLSQGAETPQEASNYFTAAVAIGACSSAGFGSSVQDLKSRYTSIIYALTSAAAVVCGSCGTYLTGVLLDNTHSWDSVFQVTAAVYLAGAVWYLLGYNAEPLVDPPLP